MDRAGKCLCGAVAFTAKDVETEGAACHCGMCRRWCSGPFIGVGAAAIEWQDEAAVSTIQSSSFAERGFCSKCGTGLFYRVTSEGKYHGVISVALGTLEDQSGVTLKNEWFIDKKPDAYSLDGERNRVTEAEVFAMFGG